MNAEITLVNKALDQYLPKGGKLGQAMRYAVFAGGKRFRPVLCFAAAKALGHKLEKVLPIACALELLHTFTLIHDDLPAMDNSALRRGKPSCHKQFDEATAILAGDALNTLAFELLARETKNAQVVAEVGHALIEVVEGQMLDMESEKRKLSLKALYALHKKKTAALLVACVRAPAVYLKASPSSLRALSNYALHLGLAFQIADDILDKTASAKSLGKPVSADAGKGFVAAVGIDRAQKLAEKEKQAALLALRPFGNRAQALRRLAEFVVERNN